VTTQLLEMGIDSTWNDNNEYEVWDGEARCYGFGAKSPSNIFAR
jgi:alpha-glucosidase